MSCSNWMLTVFALLIFIFAMWYEMIGATVSKWVIGVSVIAILIIAWTGVKCSYCKETPDTAVNKVKQKKK